jgi:hypothetical protein
VTVCSLAILIAFAMKAPPPSDEEQAVRILRLSHMSFTWSAASKVSADLTGDGVPEVAMAATSPKQLAVGIILGPVGPLSKMLVLSWAAELLGGPSCVSTMKLEMEDPRLPPNLWGCPDEDQSYFCRDTRELAAQLATAASQGMKAVVFRGEGCHPVHAIWDKRTDHLGWWRELPATHAPSPQP